MARLFLLNNALDILAEADSYERIYEVLLSEEFATTDAFVSYDPPIASLLMWKGKPLD